MAVTITTKFYQAAAWKDLSKIVFTSPNMDSPNTAGTRSHIFPGGAIPLGMWYEDLSNMYRIEASQEEDFSHYLNYKVMLTSPFNLDSPTTYVTTSGVNQTDIIGYVRDYAGVEEAVGTPVLYYGSPTLSGAVITSSSEVGGYEDDLAFGGGYWRTTIANLPAWWQIELAEPRRLARVLWTYGDDIYKLKAFRIEAKINASDDYTILLSGQTDTGSADVVFDNDIFYKYYRIYIISAQDGSAGVSLKDLAFYDYNNTSDGDTPKTFYEDGNVDNKIYVDNVVTNTDSPLLYLKVDSVGTSSSGTLASGTLLYTWGTYLSGYPDVNTSNSVLFDVTLGECYDCRLTAWDDVTHSTTSNEIIAGDHCRVSAMVYNCKGSKTAPTENDDLDNIVFMPVYNRIFKGNTVVGDTNYYYGDFDMRYRYQADIYGDYLIFKPMLYGIHSGISYGVHDFLITLHYSYT